MFLYKCKLHKLPLWNNKVYILAYHMISDKPNGFFPENSVADFLRQIKYLKKNYKIVNLEEIPQLLFKRNGPGRCVALTFDDGFKDNYLKAYTILKEYHIPATIFLTTGYIDKGEAPWFINFRSLFMHTRKERLEINLGAKLVVFSLKSLQQKRSASDCIMKHLQACSNDERLAMLDRLPSLLSIDSPFQSGPLMLSWKEIKEMSNYGITFGSHTVNHPVLSQIDNDLLRSEIACSKTVIENNIGKPVKTFAYPFGKKEHFPKHTSILLKELGFTCAVTTEPGANTSGTDIYQLKRSAPWEFPYV